MLFTSDVEHDHLAIGPDPERRSPERQSGGDIDMAVSPHTVAIALLEQMVGDQVERPNLSTVRMPAELKVDASLFCFRQIIGLMIQ